MHMAAVKVVIAIAGVIGLMLPEKKVASKLSVEGVDLKHSPVNNNEKAFFFTTYRCEKHYIEYHLKGGILMQSNAFHSADMRLDEGYHCCLLLFV
jgi:hypothetical protein